jgi:hypothetical protein
MKYLKYYESYLRQGKGQLPIQEITEDEFKKFLQTNCKEFLKVVKDIDFTKYNRSGPIQLLYRKFKSNYGNFLFTNPKESEHRRIAPWSTIGNWHNLLVSNLDSWKKYPRRNKSMISSGWDRARSHGGTDLYLVIPFDSTKIGVCRVFDFWESFNTWDKRIYINDWVKGIINLLENQTGLKFDDDNWEDLLPHLDRKYKIKFFDGYDVDKTLLDNLNYFLDPRRNQFQLLTFGDVSKIQKKDCRECWFEDDAIMVHWDYVINNPTLFKSEK